MKLLFLMEMEKYVISFNVLTLSPVSSPYIQISESKEGAFGSTRRVDVRKQFHVGGRAAAVGRVGPVQFALDVVGDCPENAVFGARAVFLQGNAHLLEHADIVIHCLSVNLT